LIYLQLVRNFGSEHSVAIDSLAGYRYFDGL
jgi:hypothetical protein